MSTLEEKYELLPSQIKDQLKTLESHFEKDRQIRMEAESFLAHRKSHKKSSTVSHSIKKKATRLAIFHQLEPMQLLRRSFFSSIFCYDDSGEKVLLKHILHKDEHVRVIDGISFPSNTPVVMKYYKSGKKDVTSEIAIYNKMKALGANVPKFSTHYQFWQQPVLVMEKLQSVGKDDNEFEMARQVIGQLRLLHTFSVHNDLKPGNIMKRSATGEYFVIDYGGCAHRVLGHGYARGTWTPFISCMKPREKNQITTGKHDLIELGYTMKAIQNMRTGIKGKVRFGEKGPDHNRTGFTGRLEQYMNRVHQIDERNIVAKDYDDLIQILIQ